MLSSSSGNMGPAPVGVHCLSCNEFPSSAIVGQTVQLLYSSLYVEHVEFSGYNSIKTRLLKVISEQVASQMPHSS